MKKTRFILLFCVFLFCLFLVGCTQESSDEAAGAVDVLNKSVELNFSDIPEFWYNAAVNVKWMASILISFCILCGLTLAEMMRKREEIRVWSIKVLVLKIPLFVAVAVHLYCLIYGIFMGLILSEVEMELFGNIAEAVYVEKEGFGDIPELWYNGGVILKRWLAVVVSGSMLLGMGIMEVFRKNKEIQKWALTSLVMYLPAFSIIFVFLYCLLYGILLK